MIVYKIEYVSNNALIIEIRCMNKIQKKRTNILTNSSMKKQGTGRR